MDSFKTVIAVGACLKFIKMSFISYALHAKRANRGGASVRASRLPDVIIVMEAAKMIVVRMAGDIAT